MRPICCVTSASWPFRPDLCGCCSTRTFRLPWPGLQEAGHDIVLVRELAAGAPDTRIAELAQADQRTIMTFDKGFGALSLRAKPTSSPGLVLLRFVPESPEDAARGVIDALSKVDQVQGHLMVVERDRIRVRALRART
jgi:predicted nuclease of predicted toxin-antitoxin system